MECHINEILANCCCDRISLALMVFHRQKTTAFEQARSSSDKFARNLHSIWAAIESYRWFVIGNIARKFFSIRNIWWISYDNITFDPDEC
jgi:hypothetical protein